MKKQDLLLDKNQELFNWGPVPMKLFYADCLKGIFIDFPRIYKGFAWPKTLLLFKEGRGVWIQEFNELRDHGKKLFLSYMLSLDKRREARKNWEEARKDLIEKQRDIEKSNLRGLSNKNFMKLWEEFHKAIDIFWAYSIIPELSNYGSSEFLQTKLEKIVPKSEIMSVMETLTAPTGISFYQEEEIDLAQENDLKKHQKEYFWLKNNYNNVEVLPVEFFIERKKTILPKIQEETERLIEEAKNKKLKLQSKYNLSSEIMRIAEAIDNAIVWQDERKKDIWIYLHYKDLLINEFVRRYKLDKKEALYITSDEALDIMKGEIRSTDFKNRLKGCGIFAQPNNIKLIDTKKTLEYWNYYLEINTEDKIKKFNGVTASKGEGKKVTGIVKIILDPSHITIFNESDILVTTMTTPEYIFVMRRSSAIITDTGGLTSHAAIVSRELKKPCIVGTKIATKVLHDGDLVEVDANKGTIRIIEKSK